MKKSLMIFLMIFMLGGKACAEETPTYYKLSAFLTTDLIGAGLRGVMTAVKYFLTDDTKMIAELVYDGEGGGGGGGGGCGGVYNGNNGSANNALALKAVASSLTDITAETSAYPADVRVQETSIADLAKHRIQTAVKEKAALDQLSEENWAVQYRAQQRSIQAMTDALLMKKAYKELQEVANSLSSGGYSNYSEAASTVATRRLLLDALMALRKRVIAARVRARVETMEQNMNVSNGPNL